MVGGPRIEYLRTSTEEFGLVDEESVRPEVASSYWHQCMSERRFSNRVFESLLACCAKRMLPPMWLLLCLRRSISPLVMANPDSWWHNAHG
jgi:hypothetical protein